LKIKSWEFFNAKRQNISIEQAAFTKPSNVSSKFLQVSYVISPRAAKFNTPHTVVIGNTVIPSATETASMMLKDKIA
jgi:hypothetical protein